MPISETRVKQATTYSHTISMEITNKAEHLRCFYCENTARPTVEIRELKQGHEEEMTFLKNEIVFLMEGEVRFTFRCYPEKKLKKGEFIFIPVGGVFRYTVLDEALSIIFRLNDNVNLCEGYTIENLYRQKDERSQESREEVCALEIAPPLWLFLSGVSKIIQDGLRCRYYFDTKIRELFILLMAYYSREVLRNFFSLILSPDTAFSEYIRANHHRYRTIRELALSMNITAKHFEKVFSRVFGMPPGKWLNGERAQMVYHELRSNAKPIKQIADEYGFSSQQQLNRFCVRELRKNPGEIRLGKSDKQTGE